MDNPVVIGDATLYLGDCWELPPSVTSSDVAVTDPPYGAGFVHSRSRANRLSSLAWGPSSSSKDRGWEDIIGEDAPFDPSICLQSARSIIFGANHFAHKLPPSPTWLVWDKRDGSTSDNHSDCELIWSNVGGPARIFRHLWRGVVRAGEDNAAISEKYHPCQKPIELMRWLVAMTSGVVVDPYMGSGTTGVACMQLGRKFIGIEIERKYFDIACERIDNAQRQMRMFA